ncbi:MAG: class I SAM-dependent methyltransferase [Myxococcota bacterium]
MPLRESEIRPVALMNDKRDKLRLDREFLLAREHRFVDVACPACGHRPSAPWDSKDGFQFVQCSACSTIYMNPRPNQDLLLEFYRQSLNYAEWNRTIFPATEKARMEKIIRPRAARLVDASRRLGVTGGTVLEIGAAYGTFGLAIEEIGYFDRYVAVEPTSDLAQTCRNRGFETHECAIEELNLEDERIDVVAAFEVIEHLFDPECFVSAAIRIMRPGGLLILSCPNSDALGPLTLKACDPTFNHEHLNYFTPSSLSRLLKGHGLEIEETHTPGQLDVELLASTLEQSESGGDHGFWRRLFAQASQDDLDRLQGLIAKVGLSSHMWIIARKPVAGTGQ